MELTLHKDMCMF